MRSMVHLFVAGILMYVCVEATSGLGSGGGVGPGSSPPGSTPPGSIQADIDSKYGNGQFLKSEKKNPKDEELNDEAGKYSKPKEKKDANGLIVFLDFQEGQNEKNQGEAHHFRPGPTLEVNPDNLDSAKEWFEDGEFSNQAMDEMQDNRNGGRFDGKYVLISRNTKFDNVEPGSMFSSPLDYAKKKMTMNQGDLVQGVIIYCGANGGWVTKRTSGKGGGTEWLGQPRQNKGALKEAYTGLKKKVFGKRLLWKDLDRPGKTPKGKHVPGAYTGEDHKFKREPKFRYTLRLWQPYASFDMILTPMPEWKQLSQYLPMIEFQIWQMEEHQKNEGFKQMGFSHGNPMGMNNPFQQNSMGLNNPYSSGNNLGAPGSGSFGAPNPYSIPASSPNPPNPYSSPVSPSNPYSSPSNPYSSPVSSPNPPNPSNPYGSQTPGDPLFPASANSAPIRPKRRKKKVAEDNAPSSLSSNSLSSNSMSNSFGGVEKSVSGKSDVKTMKQAQFVPSQQQVQEQPLQPVQQMQQAPPMQQQQPVQMQQQQPVSEGQQPLQQAPVQQGKDYEQDDYWMAESDPNHINMPDTVREESEAALETEVGSGAQSALLPRLMAQGEAWTTKHQEWLLHGAFLVVGLIFGYAGRGAANPGKQGVYAKLLDEV